ncbi:DNRLRE domain-containing protein [Winogradskya consettensis]|uniref:DNRLRE domain-containing protein n=1 Tax=Winogradskya consettensis TaxID=113560 RepID=UPI001BB37889|nr:DNRLRE domain-containing protein [Actinoplanes consettensis]
MRSRLITAAAAVVLVISGSPAQAQPAREPSPQPPAGTVLRPPAVQGRELAASQPPPAGVLPAADRPVPAKAIPAARRAKELTGRRTATTKTYQLADGRLQTETSREPVHYRDGKGHWQDIDTRPAATTAAGYRYAATKNTFGSSFGDRTDRLLKYTLPGGHGLTMGLDGAARAAKPTADGDTVTYAGVAGTADLEYELTRTATKEKIVLKAPPAGAASWTFTLDLDKVRAVPQADGSVAFYATDGVGPALFTMPKPYMYDSKPDPQSPTGTALSQAVTQRVTQAGGRTLVTITADPAWLSSPERTYPVVVDPTIKLQPTIGKAQDVMLASDTPTTNYDNVWRLSAGVNTAGTFRSLTKFDLSQIPAGVQLDSAQLQMYYDQTFGGADDFEPVFEARKVTAAWAENTATWNTTAASFGEVGDNTERVDDVNTAKIVKVGPWSGAASGDKSQAINGTYLINSDTKTGDSVTWVPRLTESGQYEVQVHYVPGSKRATNAPYTVSYDGGTAVRPVNQTGGSGNGTWLSIGTYPFKAGTTHKVTLGDVAGKEVVADAVRFVKRAEATKVLRQTNVWHSFSVRSIVQKWLDGEANNGFMVKAKDETKVWGGPRYESGDFSYGGEDDHGPKLILTWGRPGVSINPVTTVRATGADLSWTTYADPSTSPDDDLLEYEVHASKEQNFWPSAATLVAPVRAGRTTYNDTHAAPGDQLFYTVAVRTRDGALLPSPTEMVKLPAAGQVVKFFGGADDNTLTSAKPTNNWDTLDSGGELQIGNKGTTYGTSRAVVKFPSITGLPPRAKVLDAEVGLWGWYAEGANAGATPYELRGLTRDFNETTSTWNSAQSGTAWTTAGGDFETTVQSTAASISGDPGWTQWDAGPLVQRWVDTPSTNKGVVIKVANEAGNEQRSLFLSAEAQEPALRPRLRVVYTAPDSTSTYYAPTTPGRMIPADQYLVPVTLTNTTGAVWSPADWVVSYRWQRQDGTDVTTAGNRIETPLPSAQAPGGVVTVTATVRAPDSGDDGDRREPYVLKWELRNKTTGQWLSQTTTIEPLDQSVAVEDPTSDQLGLEKFYHYAGGGAGAGATVMVNQFSGNAVVGYNPISNPSQGVSTFVRLTYNSQDTSTSYAGLGWSLSTSSVVRLGSPLEFRGGTTTWPQQVAMTDGDGTTHLFNLDKHDSTNTADWRYVQPSGVHMYLQRTNSGDTTQAWTMTRPDRSQFVFDEQGFQTAVRERNGNKLTFTYERRTVNNRTTSVLRYLTDPANRRTLTLDYYAAGDSYEAYVDGTKQSLTDLQNPAIIDQVKAITDISGRRVSFVYSDAGLLREVADAADPYKIKTFAFAYDESEGSTNARLTKVTDPRASSGTKVAYNEPGDAFQQGKVNTVTDRLNKPMFFEYADPDGTASGAVTSTVTDAKGRITENAMDGYGRVTRITDAKQRTTLLGWDADNNVTRLDEPGGAVTTWRFDQTTGYPLEMRDPEANKNNTPSTRMGYQFGLAGHTADLTEKVSAEGRRWLFAHDAVGNLTSVTDPKGTATTTAGDYATSYTYDSAGRMLTTTDANDNVTGFTDYDVVGYPKTITDALTNATKYTYSSTGDVLTVTDANTKTSTYTYDGFRRPLTTKVPKDATAGRYITTPAPSYDANDNVLQTTSPTGAKTTATYDALDRQSTVATPKDTTTSDAPTTRYEYDQVGNLSRVTEPKGTLTPADTQDYVTSYVYNELNQVTDVVDALNGRVSATYDLAGNVVAQYDQRKNATADTTDYTTKFTYDLSHRLKTTIDAKGFTTGQEYDKDGNPTESYDQDGNRTYTKYDERNAVVEKRVPYSAGVYRTTRYGYDEVGNQNRAESPRGVDTTGDTEDFTTVTLYDKLNRASEVQQPYDKADTKFKTPAVTKYTYNKVGQLERVSAPPSENETVRNDTVQTYFDNGWVKTSQDAAWNITTTYDYDDNGSQTSRAISATGATTRQMTWTYFPDGKRKSTNDNGAGSGTPAKDFAFSYDVNGNLTQMLDNTSGAAIGTYAVGYDGVNRVAGLEEKNGSTVKNTTTFEYEPNDLLKRRTHDLQVSTYTYEPQRDLVAQIKNAETLDDPKPKYTKYAYTRRGEVDTETKGNNNVVTSDYFLNGASRSTVEKKSDGTVVNQHTYEYAANGQKSKDVQHKQNADNKTAYLDTTSTYAYDPQDRVRTVTKTGSGASTESYVHDANSNVVSQTVGGTTTAYTYKKNRLESAAVGSATASYAYDPYGRLKTITSAGTTLESYTYDGFDHVVKNVKNPGDKTTDYKYDPLDRMSTRTYGGKTTTYAYLGLTKDVSAELEGTKVVKSYQRGPGGGLLSQIKTNADDTKEDSYTGYDGQSDIEQITDDKGDGRATYGYTAYGKNDTAQFTGADKPDASNPENPDKVPYNSYRFQSKRYDQASGDYDMGFRDYDPGINQFLSRDNYNGALADLGLAADPYTGNRYAFAGGNPISNVELDGHNFLTDAADAIGDGIKNVVSDAKKPAKEFGSAFVDHVKGSVKEGLNTYAELDDCSSGDSDSACKSLENKAKQAGELFDKMEDCGYGGSKGACGQVENAAGCGKGTSGATCAGNLTALGVEAFVGNKLGKGLTSRTGANCLSNSFAAGTLVLMADGSTKPIEDIDVGDKVLAGAPEENDTETEPVTRTITGTGDRDLVTLTIDTDHGRARVTATAAHPFWNADRSDWIDAAELRSGDHVTTSDGKQLTIRTTRHWTRHTTVHNLTVQDIHTYYVLAGDTPLLVHNCGRGAPDLAKRTDMANSGMRKPSAKAETTKSGQEYQKHQLDANIGPRGDRFLPTVKGPKNLETAGQKLLDDITFHPQGLEDVPSGGQHAGTGTRIIRPDGVGAVFDSGGQFSYFGKFRYEP